MNGTTIMEVHDAEPDVAALRGAMPELFDARALVVESAEAFLRVSPRARRWPAAPIARSCRRL